MGSTLPPSSLPARRQSLVNQVLNYLQQQIATGAFPVGSKLPAEAELMAQLAVGRSTLREAMRVLAHMGFVEVQPGDGTYVCTPPPEAEPLGQRLQRAKVFDVYEVRRTLELECVRLAALRRDEQDLARLQQAVQKRREHLAAGQEQAFIDADVDFHIAIADATKNAVLADLYRAFINVHRETWIKASEVPGLNAQGQALHEQIAEAIAQRDSQGVQRLLGRMLDASTDRFQQILQDEGKSDVRY
jgi:GntR family transcriptional repressor for pyruvate dehydrogenase complex